MMVSIPVTLRHGGQKGLCCDGGGHAGRPFPQPAATPTSLLGSLSSQVPAAIV